MVINFELPLLWENVINYHLTLQQMQRIHVTRCSQPWSNVMSFSPPPPPLPHYKILATLVIETMPP